MANIKGNTKDPLNNDEFRELLPHLPASDILLIEYQNKTDKKWTKMLEVYDNRLKIYSCNLCSLRIAGPKGLTSHFEGKKHRSNISMAGQLFHPNYTHKKQETNLALVKKSVAQPNKITSAGEANAPEQKVTSGVTLLNESKKKKIAATPALSKNVAPSIQQKSENVSTPPTQKPPALAAGANTAQQKTAIPAKVTVIGQKPGSAVKNITKTPLTTPAKKNVAKGIKAPVKNAVQKPALTKLLAAPEKHTTSSESKTENLSACKTTENIVKPPSNIEICKPIPTQKVQVKLENVLKNSNVVGAKRDESVTATPVENLHKTSVELKKSNNATAMKNIDAKNKTVTQNQANISGEQSGKNETGKSTTNTVHSQDTVDNQQVENTQIKKTDNSDKKTAEKSTIVCGPTVKAIPKSKPTVAKPAVAQINVTDVKILNQKPSQNVETDATTSSGDAKLMLQKQKPANSKALMGKNVTGVKALHSPKVLSSVRKTPALKPQQTKSGITPMKNIAPNLFSKEESLTENVQLVKNPYAKSTTSEDISKESSQLGSNPTSQETGDDVVDLDEDVSLKPTESKHKEPMKSDDSTNKVENIGENEKTLNKGCENCNTKKKSQNIATNNKNCKANDDDDDDVIIIEDERPTITVLDDSRKEAEISVVLTAGAKPQRANAKKRSLTDNIQSNNVVPSVETVSTKKHDINPIGNDNEDNADISTKEINEHPPAKYRKVLNPAAAFVKAQKSIAAKEKAEENKSNTSNKKPNEPQYQTNRILIPSSSTSSNKMRSLNSKNDVPKFSTKTFSLRASEEIEGLIGVEYVAKILRTPNDRSPRYECCLCEVRLDGVGMQCHLLGYNHRLKYCEKHFPTCIRQYRQHMTNINQADIFRVLEPILRKLAKAIEAHHGRELPYECLESEFDRNRMDIMSKIYSFRHACEYQGPSFTNVVDTQEILNLIEKRNLYRAPNISKIQTFDARGDRSKESNKRLSFQPGPGNTITVGTGLPYNAGTSVLDDDIHKQKVEEFLRANRLRSPHDRRRSRSRSESRSLRRDHRSRRLRSRSISPSGRRRYSYAATRRSISPLREGDIWQAYRHMFDRSKEVLKESYRGYRKDPESHPMYEEEWQKFWKMRKEQLMAEGRDHRTYNYQPEWVQFFKTRIEEIYDQDVENLKITTRQRLILPMTNDMLEDPKYHVKNDTMDAISPTTITNTSLIPVEQIIERPNRVGRPHIIDDSHNIVQHSHSIEVPHMVENQHVSGSARMVKRPRMDERFERSQIDERLKMDERSQIMERSHNNERHNRPQMWEQSQSVEKTHMGDGRRRLNEYHQNMRDISGVPGMTIPMEPHARQPSPENLAPYEVIPVLRLMTALEEHLGSLGPKIVDLLSKSLTFEKTHPSKVEAMVLNSETCTLLETAMEKLKGVLYAGLLEGSKVRAFKKVISDTEDLLAFASDEGLRDKQPPPPPSISTNLPKPLMDIGLQPSAKYSANRMPISTSSTSSSTAFLSQDDKKDLASKLAAKLAAQGKTNFDPNQLQQLISVYSLIEKKKRETAESVGNSNSSSNQNKTLSDTLAELIHGSSSNSNNSYQEGMRSSSMNNMNLGRSSGGGIMPSSSSTGNRINYPIPKNNINPSSTFSNASVNNFVSMLGRNMNNTSGSDLWKNLQSISRDMNSSANNAASSTNGMNRGGYMSSGNFSNQNNYNPRNDGSFMRRGESGNDTGRFGGSFGGGGGLRSNTLNEVNGEGSIFENSFSGNGGRNVGSYYEIDGNSRNFNVNERGGIGSVGSRGPSNQAGLLNVPPSLFSNNNAVARNSNSNNNNNSRGGNQIWMLNPNPQMNRANNSMDGNVGRGGGGGGGQGQGKGVTQQQKSNQRNYGRGNNNWRSN